MIAGRDSATPGEAKNSWLTGTAAWTFVSVSQGLLGVLPTYDGLRIDPCIPKDWPEFTVTRRFRGTEYQIHVRNPNGVSRGVARLSIDGRTIPGNVIPLSPGDGPVRVEIVLGE